MIQAVVRGSQLLLTPGSLRSSLLPFSLVKDKKKKKISDCVRAGVKRTDSSGVRCMEVPAGCRSAGRAWQWRRSRSPGETAC